MTAMELRDERDELCREFGFEDRWTAMIYQWCRDVFKGSKYDRMGEAVHALKSYVQMACKVPKSRLKRVDFGRIAVCLGIVKVYG